MGKAARVGKRVVPRVYHKKGSIGEHQVASGNMTGSIGEHGPISAPAVAELKRRLLASDPEGMVRVTWVLAQLAGKPDVVTRTAQTDDEMLTVDQVAARLGLTPRAVYSRAAGWPFTVKISHRVLRFSLLRLELWLAERAAPQEQG